MLMYFKSCNIFKMASPPVGAKAGMDQQNPYLISHARPSVAPRGTPLQAPPLASKKPHQVAKETLYFAMVIEWTLVELV